MAGAGEVGAVDPGVRRNVLSRIPWVLCLAVGGVTASIFGVETLTFVLLAQGLEPRGGVVEPVFLGLSLAIAGLCAPGLGHVTDRYTKGATWLLLAGQGVVVTALFAVWVGWDTASGQLKVGLSYVAVTLAEAGVLCSTLALTWLVYAVAKEQGETARIRALGVLGLAPSAAAIAGPLAAGVAITLFGESTALQVAFTAGSLGCAAIVAFFRWPRVETGTSSSTVKLSERIRCTFRIIRGQPPVAAALSSLSACNFVLFGASFLLPALLRGHGGRAWLLSVFVSAPVVGSFLGALVMSTAGSAEVARLVLRADAIVRGTAFCVLVIAPLRWAWLCLVAVGISQGISRVGRQEFLLTYLGGNVGKGTALGAYRTASRLLMPLAPLLLGALGVGIGVDAAILVSGLVLAIFGGVVFVVMSSRAISHV